MSTRSSSQKQPTLRKPSAGDSSWCIFRAPRSLVQINEKAFEPQVVSIGPYHHGKERLNMVEQYKPQYLSALLERTRDSGVEKINFHKKIASMEKKIRDCYSEELPWISSDLVEQMVLDACFIVEVFRIHSSVVQPDPHDPFIAARWIFTFLRRDLLLIENQIPFFVLQEVFDLSEGNTADKANPVSLSELALKFFNIGVQRPRNQSVDVEHLLDLLRQSFAPSEMKRPVVDDCSQSIPSATQLCLSGFKFKPRKQANSNLLDVQFYNGVLQMSPLILDNIISSFFLNCVAFEQYYASCSKDITSYVVFIICLVSTEMDAELLSKKQLLVNHFGSNAEVATFFNDLRQDITFDISGGYLAELLVKVNKYHQNGRLPRIKRYFAASWPTIVAVASFVVSVFTFVSAFYTIYAYYSPRK